MARFSNAIGYILELRDQENLSWFSNICDLAVSSNTTIMNQIQVESLHNILNGTVNYTMANIAQPATQQNVQTTQTAQNPIHLENISNFQNFKNLSNSMELSLDKRIAIIFGMTGSGKSSLCESLKILAKSELPQNPFINVRHIDTQPQTSFEYKFTTDTNSITWNESIGFGFLSDRIKYFDSAVSLKLLTEPAETEKIVAITPFRLELFNTIGDLVKQLRSFIDLKISLSTTQINTQIESLKNIFSEYLDYNTTIRDLDINNFEDLQITLNNHTALEPAELESVQNLNEQLTLMQEASSEPGLRLQKNEFDSLLNFGRMIKKIIRIISKKPISEAFELNRAVEELKTHKKLLATEIIPDNTNDEEFIKFIEASNFVFNYNEINDASICPLCNQKLDENAVDLFKKYHQFLIDAVGQRITENESKLSQLVVPIQEITRTSIESNSVSDFASIQTQIDYLLTWFSKIQVILGKNIQEYSEDDLRYYDDTTAIQTALNQIAKEILQRYRTIKYATSNSTELNNQITQTKSQLTNLNFRALFDSNIATIRNLLSDLNNLSTLELNKTRASFPALLAKITNKGKEAYRELVVSEFTRILDQEYQALSGKTLDQFGVKIIDRASDQTVSVNTNIGSEPLTNILSEGEQKIHSLSLFFSELIISDHNVIVFDDPVNSFDYNYSNKFTEHLRDYIIANPAKQFIILTHNWDFFVYAQMVFNRANLNNDISIQVIEQCAIVKEYTEDVNRIKDLLNSKLAETGILSTEDKELLAGNLRRLIESVINKCVFNKQRHQFKQTSLNISAFNQFTKLVALTTVEATQLRDLYSNLSVPEHDDPRNHYRNIDRATFQRWFDDIETIEINLENRRPT